MNFYQFSVHSQDLPSASFNFSCRRETVLQLPSHICVAAGPSINFSRVHVIFPQLPSSRHWAGRHSVNFLNFRCGQYTLCQILSNFCAAGSPFLNFRKLFVRLEDLPSTFRAPRRPSVNCRQHFVTPETYRQLTTSFRVTRRPSANFIVLSVQPGDFSSASMKIPSGRETFHQLQSIFCTAKKISVNIPCVLETVRLILSTFYAAG